MTNHNENIDTSIGCNDMFHARNMIILQQFLKAKELLQAVIAKRKDAAAPHFHLGFVYVELMCHPKALEHFKQAARLKPKIKKYRQVETWYSQIYDTDKRLKNESDFMKAIAALIIDINPTKFEYIYKFYNATTEEILLALNDAILLYHPMNHHMENVQQFLLNKYSYISLTRYKSYCRANFGYVESDPILTLYPQNKYLPFYSSWQQRAGVQMVVQKARSCYPREPITHSTNGKLSGSSIWSGVSDEERLQKNKKYILMNKLKRMCLIYGYIRKNKFNPITDIIQVIDIFFHENVWEWKVADRSIAYSDRGHTESYFDLQVWKGESPFQFVLWYDRRNSADLFLNMSAPMVVIPFIKIYYELYVYDGNKKIIYMKGTMKYRGQDILHGDDKISSQFQLFPNNNNMNLMIRFLSVEYLRFDNYLQHITIKENVSFKWTISTNFKHKPEPSIQFSPNFGNNNWCLHYGHTKHPTHKKKKKFYIGIMLITLPSHVNHLKIQLNIFNDDKKNTKVFVNKVWPGFESALQIPFKYEILYQQSLSIHVNIKILNAFDHKGKKINIKDASMELL
eukprot:549179_1